MALRFGIAIWYQPSRKQFKVQQEVIADMYEAVRGFEVKPRVFQKQLQNVNVYYFSSFNLLRNVESVSVPLQVSVL